MTISSKGLVKELFDDSLRAVSTVDRGICNVKNYGKGIIAQPLRYSQEALSYMANEARDKWLLITPYLAGTAGDIATTFIGVNKYGSQDEANPLMRNFIESYGPLEGLMIGKAIAIPCAVGLACLAGKRYASLYEQNRHRKGKAVNEKIKRHIENAGFYFINLAVYGIVISNIVSIAMDM